ncbi:MAG: F0F1 ATP synthase subunit epsilon [Pseudomonadota bacterium]
MSTIQVEIVSAEKEIFSGVAKSVVASAEMGEVGIYPKHTPLITRLKPGEVKLETESGEELVFFVSGGILEVQPHVVTILADTAMRGADLDEAKALEAKRRAEEALADKQADMDAAKALAELAAAAAQLRMIENLRKKGR